MDKKNVDTSKDKLRFFEVFKTRCSESDLGPISLNWFEELSSKAPPYDHKRQEDLENNDNSLDQSTFKTPKGKLPTNSQLASTPLIFKEQQHFLPLFFSPVKEVDQSKEEAGRSVCEAHEMSTKFHPSNEVLSPPSKASLSASPTVLKELCGTPHKNKCVLSGSLLCTPQVFAVQIPKYISESLGAEVDPDMSWSSSLATPPTLSPTVIIARGNDYFPGTKQHKERIALIMHSLLTKYGSVPWKNSVNVQSASGTENFNAEMDSKTHNFGSLLDHSFVVNGLASKSDLNHKPPNASEDEEMAEVDMDTAGGMKRSFSVGLNSSKAFLRKAKTTKWNKKKYFEVKQSELQENVQMIKDSKEIPITEYERELNFSKSDLQTTILQNNSLQKPSENQKGMNVDEEMSSSLLSVWSQLDLSGLDVTQLENVSSSNGSSSSNLDVKKNSEDQSASTVKECADASILESFRQNTSNLIKAHKLLSSSSPEKLLPPENSAVPLAVSDKGPTLVKCHEAEQASVVNVSENGSYLMENATFTEFSEVHRSFFHQCSRQNENTTSDVLVDSILVPSATDGERLESLELKTMSSVSNLKRKPKKFIYMVNNNPIYQKEKFTHRDVCSTLPLPICKELKSVFKADIRNKGQTEEPSKANEHVHEQKEKVVPERNSVFNTCQETQCNNKMRTKCNFTDQLSFFPDTYSNKDTAVPSSLKDGNQGTETSENKVQAINNEDSLGSENGEKCASLTNLSSFQEALPEVSTLATQALKIRNKQAGLTQPSWSNKAQISVPGYLSEKMQKPTIDESTKRKELETNLDFRQPLPLYLKENAYDYKQAQSEEHAIYSNTQHFGSFKTASSKQISSSHDNLRRGKQMFKDIEDQFLKDLPNEAMQKDSNQNALVNIEISSVGREEHISDLQVNSTEFSYMKNILSEYANLSFQNKLKNSYSQGKYNLTASQEAEVTELSNILEETSSQFEFSQLRKQSPVPFNTSDVSRNINKTEIKRIDINSEVGKEIDIQQTCQKEAQRPSDLSPPKCIGITEESKIQSYSSVEVASVNSSNRNWKKACLVPNISVPLQLQLPGLGDTGSVEDKEINISKEIINKATKLVDCLDGGDGVLHCHAGGSNAFNNGSWRKKDTKEVGLDWCQRVKEVNAEYMMKNGTTDTIAFVKENNSNHSEDNVVHISSSTEVNLKIVQKYSVHMTGENNHSILVTRHFVNCGETQCNYNLQETLSDLTCLVAVGKIEKKSTLNNADEKEILTAYKDENMSNLRCDHLLQSVHDVADRNISLPKTGKSKTIPFLADSCLEEELDNMLSSSITKTKGNSKKGAIMSVKKNTCVNQNEDLFSISHQKVPENRKIMQNDAIDFHTASGKQIAIADESLAKARHIFSEENVFPEIEDAFRSFVESGIQALEKDNGKIDDVREELGEGTEKHHRERLNAEQDFENDLTYPSSKRYISKSMLINSDNVPCLYTESGKGLAVKQDLQHISRNTSNTLTNDNQNLDSLGLTFNSPSKQGSSDFKNDHSALACLHNRCSERNSLSEKFTYNSEKTSSESVNTEIKIKNESDVIQKCDLALLNNNALHNNSATASTAKLPTAFSTASGKDVGVSQEVLKKIRHLLHKDFGQSTQERTGSQSKHVSLESCPDDTFDVAGYAHVTNCMSVEKSAAEDLVAPNFPQTKEDFCEEEQALQYTTIAAESNCRPSGFQANNERPATWTSSKLNLIKSNLSTDNCGFSTASGKPVQLSEESLKKARLFFSEIEKDGSSDNQSCVSAGNCSYDKASSVVNKAVATQNKLLVSKEEKRLPNIKVNSDTPCGFSTASGKKVQISEKALQKVMVLLKEFDDDVCSNNVIVDPHSLRQDHILPIKGPSIEAKAEDEFTSKSKPPEKSNAFYFTTSSPNLNTTTKIPMCMADPEKCNHLAELEKNLARSKETGLLETNQTCLNKNETKNDASPKGNLLAHCSIYSRAPENYLETEASESARAFMEDDDFSDSTIQRNMKQLTVVSGNNNFLSNTRLGKRRMEEENPVGEPPIKRKLLPEFDSSEMPNKSSLMASKSTPDGVMNDRRKFRYNISLKPVISGPFSSIKERQEVMNPNLTTPDQDREEFKSDRLGQCISKHSSSRPSGFLTPFSKTLNEEKKKAENHDMAKKPVKVFVPPFKRKPRASEDDTDNSTKCDLLGSQSINGKEELISVKGHEPEMPLVENHATEVFAVNSECSGANSDLTRIANLHYARNLQEMRIIKKQRQRICPQPSSLYLAKMSSAACRIPLKVAVKEKLPGCYTSEQLYTFGVSKQCIKINSINAEDFHFLFQDFFSKEYFLEGHGIQLADGGYLIPTDEGKAGKEEFYRALCDTPGVDPKLVSKAWVYNHYRWIIWKLAAMEVAFPQEFANICLTPERVLLQLKYRYDVEIDKCHRSALKRIMERDDVAAKTLVLCISKIISLNARLPHICGNKSTAMESEKDVAVIEVTDGWYGVKAVLDPCLQALLCKERLAVGQKILVHGAELIGPQDASSPLEAPGSLMLKISANSTRRARWYTKLGYHRDPRPFRLFLSSLFSGGGNVGCVDIVIQRVYPTQWMEKIPTGSYVFRNCRAEEREATKHAENRQKTLEVLLAKIQVQLEKNKGFQKVDEGKRKLRSHTLTRQQIRSLQDGAELYEAICNAPDPAYMEGYFSDDQLKALNSHRQVVNDRKQAQIEAEFRKAVESAEQGEHNSCRRDVTAVMKLRIVDYSKGEKSNEAILNIWRPSSDLCGLLKEGRRYRIFQLAASQSKGQSGTANVQLTATKKTQYLQLQVSEEILSEIYRPRESLRFNRLFETSFQPTWSEVDLVGYVVSLRKGTGFSTLVYLSDEEHNLIVVQIRTDLKQLAVEDIIIPSVLISAINLQWRSEFRSALPILFASDLTAFSSNPKESHLQRMFNELRNTVENDSCFGKNAQHKLVNLLQTDSSHVFKLPKECGLEPIDSSWKLDAENTPSISTSCSELRHQNPLTLGRLDSKPLVSLGSTKAIQGLQEPPKNCKKRKAMDLLNRLPSPPPVKPISTFVSPSVRKAFQPPRCSGTPYERSQGKRESTSVRKPTLTSFNETLETNFVADEELAMINTQALLGNFPEVLKEGPLPAGGKNVLQDNIEGTKPPGTDINESHDLLLVQKRLQRPRKQNAS